MPVNSFDDYPMSWKPKKELLTAPKYRALADLLADDILTGKLSPHTKLPPQRELADYLDPVSYTHLDVYKRQAPLYTARFHTAFSG